MSDLIRPLRGAFPGEAIEPDADVRAQLALLGAVGVRYGGFGLVEALGMALQLLEDPPDGNGWLVEVVSALESLTPNAATEVDVSAHLTGAKAALLFVQAFDPFGSGAGALEFRPTSGSTGSLRFAVSTVVDFCFFVIVPLVDDAFYITSDDGGGSTLLEGKVYLYGGIS